MIDGHQAGPQPGPHAVRGGAKYSGRAPVDGLDVCQGRAAGGECAAAFGVCAGGRAWLPARAPDWTGLRRGDESCP